MLLTVERVVEFKPSILAVALFNMSILRYTIHTYSMFATHVHHVYKRMTNQVSNLDQTISGFI